MSSELKSGVVASVTGVWRDMVIFLRRSRLASVLVGVFWGVEDTKERAIDLLSVWEGYEGCEVEKVLSIRGRGRGGEMDGFEC
jgi:hypothetical protein